MTNSPKPILKLLKVKKYFPIKRNVNLKAVQDISLVINEGEKFGVVGESGCGKSTLGRVILQLYEATSGACVYYGKSIQEVYPKYIQKEISKLKLYQDKAKEYYQKAITIDSKIKQLEAEAIVLKDTGNANDTKKYDKLKITIAKKAFESKELKKNASRQLREGSRTVGSLILCENIEEIATIFQKAEDEIKIAYALIQDKNQALDKFQKNEIIINQVANIDQKIITLKNKKTLSLEEKQMLTELEKTKVKNQSIDIESLKKENQKLKTIIENFNQKIHNHYEQEMRYREEAFTFRNKNILPITERCLDKSYQDKLDGNYETGINLGKLNKDEMRNIRRDMQMIFQDPSASLDPRQSIGQSIEEVFKINTKFSKEVKKAKTLELLDIVGLKPEHYYSYPNALSGGQKQRVGIARAIALDPSFIVLDEAVSALDVSVQAQILKLLNNLSTKHNLTYFFITHDLGVVKHFCDRVMVMYLGNVCELATSNDLFKDTYHPYTKSLLASVPRLKIKENKDDNDTQILQGEVPSPINAPSGCPFHTRCQKCMDICKIEKPPYIEVKPNHYVACHLFSKENTNV